MAPDGTPRAMALTSPKEGEREVCLRLLGRVNRSGPLIVLGDKGYAGADFEAEAAALGATVVRPRRTDEPEGGLHLAPLRQRIELIYWTAKHILGLERHGARTLRGLRGPHRQPASRHWLRRSHSTTSSGAPRGRWSTTWPEPWNYSSSAGERLVDVSWPWPNATPPVPSA